jgi:hypothetical protein
VGLSFDSKIQKKHADPLVHLKSWVRSLKMAPKDVVIFYYSGKCFLQKKQSLKMAHAFAERRIAKILRANKARLALAIFDCYEKQITPRDNISFSFFSDMNNSLSSSSRGMYSLFKKSSGVLIAFSDRNPSRGMYSLEKNVTGGIFTTSFLSALRSWADEPRVSWSNVIHLTRDGGRESHFQQEPFFFAQMHSHTGLNGIK